MNLNGVILAGGQSRRMGHDKAWLKVNGTPLIARAFNCLRAAGVEEIFISGREGVDYSSLPCPVLLDWNPGTGPLAGIERALAAASSPLLMVLAVDLPGMTSAFLARLIGRCDGMTGVVPRLRGELEPLAGVYPTRAYELCVQRAQDRHRSARQFARACLGAGLVRAFDVDPADAPCFQNWNTPDAQQHASVS